MLLHLFPSLKGKLSALFTPAVAMPRALWLIPVVKSPLTDLLLAKLGANVPDALESPLSPWKKAHLLFCPHTSTKHKDDNELAQLSNLELISLL